jgi:uncharacterized alpha-E superfamily protein
MIDFNLQVPMLSRVANSIYWMARYVERAENLARFIDVSLNVILDQPNFTGNEWEPLVHTTGDEPEFMKRYGDYTPKNVFNFLTFDREYHNSIISSLSLARENARTVREAISSEAWEQLNEFYHFVKNAQKANHTIDWQTDFFHQVRQQSHLFNGILDSTMSRGKGWHFANLGRLLERADKTSRILDVKYFTLLPRLQDVGTTIDDLQWSAVLRSVSGFEMYRKRYHAITVQRVVEFLILDNSFPRAIRFCIDGADESLHKIIGSPVGSYRNLAEQKLGRLKGQMAYSDVDTIINEGMHEFVDNLQDTINEIDDAIYETFFAMRQVDETKGMMQSQSQG